MKIIEGGKRSFMKDHDGEVNFDRKGKKTFLATLAILVIFIIPTNLSSQRHMEYLTRGLVAVKSSNNVFLSWRIFATDTGNVEFNIYCNDTLINLEPIKGVSNYTHTGGIVSNIYYLETIYDSTRNEISTPVTVWGANYLNITLQIPPDGTTPDGSYSYEANDASVGDLDGDGEYEIVLKWDPTNSKDNSQSGYTGNVFLDAYEMNSSLIWRIDLGINIRAGAHYTQFMVYDLNSDGIAEVVCKTAPGTKDASGEYLSKGPAAVDDDAADYRNGSGYILDGPEYLTVFDGLTGLEITTVNYIPLRATPYALSSWGDTYGNRVDRFLATVAYFDTVPSLVMCRGYYDRTTLTAWDFDGDSLKMRWAFDTETNQSTLKVYEGQGNHQISVADVDNDGKDEIIYGAEAFDDDGTPLWNTGLGHGDAMHVSDIDPNRPGLEKWGIHEGSGPGSALLDAATGEILWQTANGDVGRGVSADLSASSPGMECWGGTDGLRSATNTYVGSSPSSANFLVWWDGDLLRELLNSNVISKYPSSTLLTASGCTSNNTTKSTPTFSGDIIGDWREEVIWRTTDNKYLRLYTTITPTQYGVYTLLQDPQYRLALVWQNVAYNQPPHPGFFFGANMDTPPIPDIKVIDPSDHPVLRIVSPSNGSELGLGLDLNIIVSPIGIPDTNKIFISLDGSIVDTIDSKPFMTSLTGLNSGEHTILASAYDKKGSLVESKPVIITVDLGYPHITMTSPIENSAYLPGDTITFTADAFDTDGEIDSVAFYLNNERLFAITEEPYIYQTDNIGIGIYSVKAIAYDNNQYSTESDEIAFDIGEVLTVQENGRGFCGFDIIPGTIDNNHLDYTGDGFSNTDNALGAQIYYAIDFPETGNYRFIWRYASTSDRPGILMINDSIIGNVDFPSSGSWDVWDVASITTKVKDGITKVTIEASGNEGLANIDYMKIITLESEDKAGAVNCAALPEKGIQNLTSDLNKLKINPVPAQNYINILLDDLSESINEITIYKIDGSKAMILNNIENNNFRVDLPELQNGIYLIQVNTNLNSYISKFNIER